MPEIRALAFRTGGTAVVAPAGWERPARCTEESASYTHGRVCVIFYRSASYTETEVGI